MGQFESFIGVNFWTALFVLLNTLIIFWVAKKFLFVPVRNLIAQRQNEIDEMYSAADQAKTQAQALENEYRGRLTQAQETSDQIVKDAVARGQRNAQTAFARSVRSRNDDQFGKVHLWFSLHVIRYNGASAR